MKQEQKVVLIGALSGVLGMIVAVALLYQYLPTTLSTESLVDRIAYTLVFNVFAIIPFFVMVAAVGNARFLSAAINPLAHAENQTLEITGRVADNTLQQNFVFFISTLALSTVISQTQMSIIPAVTIVFILARLIFWIGYRIHPLYRAPGMAATSSMNLGIILFVLYQYLV